ncbi:hypothetical protein [Pseudomonas putida]|uniref:hypothetical protein n=1 Tax=Pseudomonas putida TaxID=303 RepID=UPI0018D841AB|nr:hypothetical protein [Pseudomonas putida]MBH3460240.1 hypothetical protein [Pseudomonas putida]
MADIPRRSIDDLLLRYELEPTLEDVYVEGYFDKDVLTACFESEASSKRIAYTIDSVDIPFSVLEKYGLTEGNKQRVIALCRELEAATHSSCKFLVDRDLDHWFDRLPEARGLVWTRYCALELYFFNDALMRKFLINASRSKISDWHAFITSFCSVLVFMYALRLADRELNLSMIWTDPDKDLKLHSGVLVFDRDSYINRVLSKNNRLGVLADVKVSVSRWYDRCVLEDYRLAIRGHDFVSLLAFVIKNGKGVPALGTVEAVERTFILLSTADLEVFGDLSANA